MTLRTTLVVGTRGSKLALTQARWAMDLLRQAHPNVEVVEKIITTSGDRVADVPLAQMGERGVLVRELETALLRGDIDIAIHSLKDLPSILPPEFTLAAVPVREDPRDCLVSQRFHTLEQLPDGARVGTGSPRRKAQLLAMRPGLVTLDIRGNVDTRIRKMMDGEFDAVLLAVAGLRRLGLNEHVLALLESDQMVSAVGQGALALEARSGCDAAVLAWAINHAPTHLAVSAERSLARALGASCTTPVGALATVEGEQISLVAVVSDCTGGVCVRGTGRASVDEAEDLGVRVAEDMLSRGAGEIL